MKDYEIKREIVEICHLMSERGLVGAYEGNISVKDAERLYLTPSGQSKDFLHEGKIIVTDLKGNILEGQLKPTSETPMHARCYELRPDIGAVVHCHAPYCTAYAQAGIAFESRHSPEFLALLGKVPIIPYGRPGTLDIIAGLPDVIMDYDVVLLENHGVLAVGKTVLEAYSKTLSLEMLLKTEFVRKVISNGKDNSLSNEECEYLLDWGKIHHGLQK